MCRAVVAVGTVVQGNRSLASLAADLGLLERVQQMQQSDAVVPKVKEAVAELAGLLA